MYWEGEEAPLNQDKRRESLGIEEKLGLIKGSDWKHSLDLSF
jgi:hypothetical protein